ncbi:leucine-rich repeat-containing protein 27 [Rhinophrynus dorsalis]
MHHCKSTNDDLCKVIGKQTNARLVHTEGLRSPVSSAPTPSNTLDLSKKKLHYLSEELYTDNPDIKNMHLEGNALSSIPENFFIQLPYLVWLDLRFNQITSLPCTIGKHRQLKYLLLEGNPIKALPVELGNLSTLKALNLRHCPLEFPPEDVVHKGLESILSFLRLSKSANAVSEDLESEMPPVERLKLDEMMNSSLELSGEWASQAERLQFEMLRSKIKEEEMKEMAEVQAIDLQTRTKGASRRIKKNKWNFITDSSQVMEERKHAALIHADEKEQLATANQKLKDQEILKNWQKQTKYMQDQKLKLRKTMEDHQEGVWQAKLIGWTPPDAPPATQGSDVSELQHVKDSLESDSYLWAKAETYPLDSALWVPVVLPPFATDMDAKQSRDKQKPLGQEKQERVPGIMTVKSLKEMEKDRASRDIKLDDRIRQHIQSMKERKKNPPGTAAEEMEAASKELEVATLLQAELLLRKQEQDTPLEYRFTAFTGELSPDHSACGKSQNIFAMTS